MSPKQEQPEQWHLTKESSSAATSCCGYSHFTTNWTAGSMMLKHNGHVQVSISQTFPPEAAKPLLRDWKMNFSKPHSQERLEVLTSITEPLDWGQDLLAPHSLQNLGWTCKSYFCCRRRALSTETKEELKQDPKPLRNWERALPWLRNWAEDPQRWSHVQTGKEMQQKLSTRAANLWAFHMRIPNDSPQQAGLLPKHR